MNKIQYLEPGTLLTVYCPNKLVWHFGVMSLGGKVIDRGKKGIQIRSWSEFSEGFEVKIVPRESGDFSKAQIHQRALARVGQKGYDMIFKNCEHFVSWCRKGKLVSKQLNNVIFMLIGMALFFMLMRSLNKNSK